ncbi:MAG TPA: hypothetical protein VD837_13045 [Terriglobales bacterium]|nr:hypothetical protein [Terriglobales bacterium]
MSIGARIGRLILGLPLIVVGVLGVLLVIAAPGAYGKSAVTNIALNALTFLVSAATAFLGGLVCLNSVRAPRK